MKVLKFIIAVLAFALIFSFIPACVSTEPETEERKALKEPIEEAAAIEELAEEDLAEDKDESIDVDKGIISVEITLPASFFEGKELNDLENEVEGEDIKIILNEDGSVTYKMSKSKHKELMEDIYKDQVEYIEEIKNSEDYESIKDIKYNKTFSEITLIVDQELFENSFDGFAAFGIAISSLYYQLFNGVNLDRYKVIIYYENAETGEIFGNVVYPDAFEE
jgi:hypothetical protein